MKYASLTRIGGELIAADDADYSDYFGFLKCPECYELVFLRKAFVRGDGVKVQASFVHHKAVPELSFCELRVGQYSQKDVEAKNSQAREQRLRSLRLHMWKYLKCSYLNFFKYHELHKKYHSSYLQNHNYQAIYKLATLKVENNYYNNVGIQEFIENSTHPDFDQLFSQKIQQGNFDYNLTLHHKIAYEVFKLLTTSQGFVSIREKFIISLMTNQYCLKTIIESLEIPNPQLKNVGLSPENLAKIVIQFLKHLLIFFSATIYYTPWITIFNEVEKAPNSRARNSLLQKLK